MNVSNINSDLIVLKSSTLEQGMANNTIDNISISLSVNRGLAIVKSVGVPQVRTWNAFNIPINASITITQIFLRNLVTGQLFGLLETPFIPYNEASLTNLQSIISTKLISLGITGFTQPEIRPFRNRFDYSISSLPAHVVMDRVEYLYGIITITVPFSIIEDTGMIVGVDNVIITPTFFNSLQLTEGVYSIEWTLHTIQNQLLTESACYFLEKSLKCRLLGVKEIDCRDRKQLDFTLLHYSLIQASNCNCDCEKMNIIYQYLNKHLPLTPNTEDCGC